jgi:hypothetical protein
MKRTSLLLYLPWGGNVAKAKANSGASAPKLRTPAEVAEAAIERFTRGTADGAGVDSDAWKRAISAEARVFAQELIQGAIDCVIAGRADRGGKTEAQRIAKLIVEGLAGAAG